MAELKPNGVAGVVLGAYGIALQSGLTTGLANQDTLFSLQWAPVNDSRNPLMVITKFALRAQIVTPFTAAQEIRASAFIARAYTAPDTGGTAVTLTGNNLKRRASSGTTLVADLRIATTASNTPGTRITDGNPFLRILGAQVQAAASAVAPLIEGKFEVLNPQTYPIVLANQEGIVGINELAFGAAGTVRFGVDIEWLEVLPLPC